MKHTMKFPCVLLAMTCFARAASAEAEVSKAKAVRPQTYAQMYDAGWFRAKGFSLDLGGAVHASTGGFGPATSAAAFSALASYYPVAHVGLRVGVRGLVGAAHSDDWCTRSHCLTVGLQFPVMAVLAAKAPNYGPYVTAGVGIYTRDWTLGPDANAFVAPLTAKFGAGYKFPTSNDSAVDVFAVFDVARYTKKYGLQGPEIEEEVTTTTFLSLDLGVSFDLGL